MLFLCFTIIFVVLDIAGYCPAPKSSQASSCLLGAVPRPLLTWFFLSASGSVLPLFVALHRQICFLHTLLDAFTVFGWHYDRRIRWYLYGTNAFGTQYAFVFFNRKTNTMNDIILCRRLPSSTVKSAWSDGNLTFLILELLCLRLSVKADTTKRKTNHQSATTEHCDILRSS